VFLVSPSSTDERLASTVAACRGFVYATRSGAAEDAAARVPVTPITEVA